MSSGVGEGGVETEGYKVDSEGGCRTPFGDGDSGSLRLRGETKIFLYDFHFFVCRNSSFF